MDVETPGSTPRKTKNGLHLYPVSPGDSGEGLPYAPEDWPNPGDKWRWKAGKRVIGSGYIWDRYLYLPNRLVKAGQPKYFRSKSSVEQHIQYAFPGADVNAFFASFSWNIPSKQFNSNELFGVDSQLAPISCKAENNMCSSLSGVCDPPLSEAMFCDICCSEPDFCRNCCCILCSKAVCSAFGGYSYIKCKAMFDGYICGHVAHMACAHQARMAGTVGGKFSLDAEYLCRRCDSRTDLVSHILEVLQICESINSRDEIEKTLNLAISLLHGSRRMNARRLLHHIESIVAKLKNGANFGDVWKNEDAVIEEVIPEKMADTEIMAIYSRDKWMRLKENNFQLDLSAFKCPDEVIIAILKGHPLLHAFTGTTQVSMLYLQQFWGTMKTVTSDSEAYYKATLHHTKVRVTKAVIRQVLQLPTPNSFDDVPSEANLLKDFLTMGCQPPLEKLSDFHINKIPHPWKTLFGLVNKCLSPKHAGFDKGNINILHMFHGFIFSKKYDYVELICNDLNDQIFVRDRSNKQTSLPYSRWFPMLIQHFLDLHPQIPPRAVSENHVPPKLRYFQKAKNADSDLPMIIPVALLRLADQEDRAVIEYCQRYQIVISMVQANPPEPTPGNQPSDSEGLEREVLEAAHSHDSSDSLERTPSNTSFTNDDDDGNGNGDERSARARRIYEVRSKAIYDCRVTESVTGTQTPPTPRTIPIGAGSDLVSSRVENAALSPMAHSPPSRVHSPVSQQIGVSQTQWELHLQSLSRSESSDIIISGPLSHTTTFFQPTSSLVSTIQNFPIFFKTLAQSISTDTGTSVSTTRDTSMTVGSPANFTSLPSLSRRPSAIFTDAVTTVTSPVTGFGSFSYVTQEQLTDCLKKLEDHIMNRVQSVVQTAVHDKGHSQVSEEPTPSQPSQASPSITYPNPYTMPLSDLQDIYFSRLQKTPKLSSVMAAILKLLTVDHNCQSSQPTFKRRHDDPDDTEHREGEKRLCISFQQTSSSPSSSQPKTSE